MDCGLQGKKCLITGGNTGIGFGIARVLALEGVELGVAGLEDVPKAMEELRRSSERAFFMKVDVSEEKSVVEMVQEAIRRLGQIDLYVNNAAWAWHEPVTRITSENFYRTINTNLAACVWGCREVARHMIARRSGSILVTGSTVRVCPAYRETSYRISKMGLKMYMETLAIELAPYGIRVNLLTPGHHRTRLTASVPAEIEAKMIREIPLRRLGDPQDCAAAAAFLLSDRLASYITGAEIVVDGGLALRPLPIRTDDEILQMNAP